MAESSTVVAAAESSMTEASRAEVVAEEKKTVVLKSSDGVDFVIKESAAKQFEMIKHMIEDGCMMNFIPVPNVTSTILTRVLEYCNRHADSTADADELKNWDKEFMNVDLAVLYDLLLASNYLNIKGLLDLGCQAVADMIKGKTPDQIRRPSVWRTISQKKKMLRCVRSMPGFFTELPLL